MKRKRRFSLRVKLTDAAAERRNTAAFENDKKSTRSRISSSRASSCSFDFSTAVRVFPVPGPAEIRADAVVLSICSCSTVGEKVGTGLIPPLAQN